MKIFFYFNGKKCVVAQDSQFLILFYLCHSGTQLLWIPTFALPCPVALFQCTESLYAQGNSQGTCDLYQASVKKKLKD